MNSNNFYANEATKKVAQVTSALKSLPTIAQYIDNNVAVETPNTWTAIIPFKKCSAQNRHLRVLATGSDHSEPSNEKAVFLIEWRVGNVVKKFMKFNIKNKTGTIISNAERLIFNNSFHQFFAAGDNLSSVCEMLNELKQSYKQKILSSIPTVDHAIKKGHVFTNGQMSISARDDGEFNVYANVTTSVELAFAALEMLGATTPSANKIEARFGGKMVSINFTIRMSAEKLKTLMAAQYT